MTKTRRIREDWTDFVELWISEIFHILFEKRNAKNNDDYEKTSTQQIAEIRAQLYENDKRNNFYELKK